jgi:hypothetical protein
VVTTLLRIQKKLLVIIHLVHCRHDRRSTRSRTAAAFLCFLFRRGGFFAIAS